MKLLSHITAVLLMFFALSSSAQSVQGTILNGSKPNSVYVAMRPTANFTASLTDFQFTLTIPAAAVPAAPTYTFVSLITGLSLGVTAQDVRTQMVGGVNAYVYSFSPAGTGVANTPYISGVTYNIVEVFFNSPDPSTTTTVQLAQLPNGGSIGQSNFFVAFNNNADATHQTVPFFGTGAVNDGLGYAGYSYVPLSNVVLPVKFLGFSVNRRNNDALLSWQIDNESAITERYEIERSLNGRDFKKFATLQAKKNGNARNSYDLTDANLTAISTSGIFYYRIKQLDKDGQFVYSGIKSLRLNSRGMVIGVYPNPIKQFANVSIDSELDATAFITINDAAGKQLQNIQVPLFKGPNIKKLNMSNLASGTYVLKIQTGDEIQTISVVKTY